MSGIEIICRARDYLNEQTPKNWAAVELLNKKWGEFIAEEARRRKAEEVTEDQIKQLYACNEQRVLAHTCANMMGRFRYEKPHDPSFNRLRKTFWQEFLRIARFHRWDENMSTGANAANPAPAP